VLVVDCVALIEASGNRGKVSPRNQLQILRRLATFTKREKLEVVAVMGGSPLNKAPTGKKFEGMLVRYSPSSEGHAKFLVKTARAKGSRAILVSASAETEKLAGKSVAKMRISTFRKSFETTADMGDHERGASGGRGNRPPRRRGPRPDNEPQNRSERSERPDRQNRSERPERELSEADAINELIDLVD
jgi:hypothetical protein